MIRKLLSLLAVILSISLLPVQPVQAAKSYFAEYFDVQIDLHDAADHPRIRPLVSEATWEVIRPPSTTAALTAGSTRPRSTR